MNASKILRRRILIVAGEPALEGQYLIRADVEDNPHRFGITVRHDGQKVLAVEVDSGHMRHPYVQCKSAAGQLSRLVGMALTDHALGAYRHTRGAEQCTHMFDMASLAIAHAKRGTLRRQYDVEVDCTDFRAEHNAHGFTLLGKRRLKLFRDGTLVLDWPMEGDVIVSGPHADQNVRTMMAWIEANITDLDEIEAVVVARRTLIVSTSLLIDLGNPSNLSVASAKPMGACYAFQHPIVETLTPVRGNSRNFSEHPEALLADQND